MSNLAGKVAMVTGGATGIGAAIEERLALLDVSVACCYDRSQTEATSLAGRLSGLGKEILTVKLSVANHGEVEDGI